MGMGDDRKHRATGQPRGGNRDGAGRPKNAKNTLGYGEVKAVKAAGLRVPETASEEAKALADRSQQRIIDVMECRVDFKQSAQVLKAATRLREEICGPLAQKLEHSGPDGKELTIKIVEYGDEGES